MGKVRVSFVLGVMGFLIHLFFGIFFYVLAGGLTHAIDLKPPTSTDIFMGRMVAILLFPIALIYLFVAIDKAATRSFLIVATCSKVLIVILEFLAYLLGDLSAIIPNWYVAGPIMDGVLVLTGIYVLLVEKPNQ